MNTSQISNVLLVSFDAFRLDRTFHFTESDCPHVSELLNDSTYFSKHISTGSGTSTSFPGILASSLPLEYGYRGLSEDHCPIAERLSRNNVYTIGITAQTSCSSLFNYDTGFDRFFDSVGSNSSNTKSFIKEKVANIVRDTPVESPTKAIYDLIKNHDNPPYIQADEVTDRTIDLLFPKIKQSNQTFAWIHYMEPHAPYYPPTKFIKQYHNGNHDLSSINKLINRWNRERGPVGSPKNMDIFTPDERSSIIDFYDAQAAFAVEEFERLISKLKESGELKRTAIIITSDHGEEHFEHNDFGHRPKMIEELIHVPLWIRLPENPDLDTLCSFDNITSHLDLSPTITELFGCEPSDQWQGNSLVSALETNDPTRNYAVSELSHKSGLGGDVRPEELIISVRGKTWKYVLNKQENREYLYQVGEGIDHENVIDKYPGKAKELKHFCEQRISNINKVEADSIDIDSGVEDRLRRLGYK
ncbi:sulfatase-like hydrolase/transferase [Halorubrum ezzemoulense]|uniref:sulfatase-like hydrolase/transferase n=1 Tax=Halorubrum ezzemoulense TaxID=337243 RepID=UPI00232CBDF5|nr:sulfatase-like hydrolase/transferase [Halorubrum ezzemoulense]MDB2243107.1 sulfatase-like hydrolase/transferase [Halorubrum ezzemoulense]